MENLINSEKAECYLCICGMIHSYACVDLNLLYCVVPKEERQFVEPSKVIVKYASSWENRYD